MYSVNINMSGHDFDKINIVTIHSRNGGYDKVKCKNCGLTAKRYSLDTVLVSDNIPKIKAEFCQKQAKEEYIKITRFTGCGAVFANLVDGSVHKVISIPEGEKDDGRGVWVMGVDEPVKVLNREFLWQK